MPQTLQWDFGSSKNPYSEMTYNEKCHANKAEADEVIFSFSPLQIYVLVSSLN